MEKEFLEVFRNLELKGELRALLEEVVVTKVAINQRKDHIRIYIRSRQWIHKKYIYTLENTIAAQCFPGVPMKVKILEKLNSPVSIRRSFFWTHTVLLWRWN